MTVGYLVNLYPHTTHTFVRREIAAVERLGVAVRRYSIRRSDHELADPADREEAARTRVLLDAGVWAMAGAVLGAMLRNPLRLVMAAAQALRLGRRSQQGVLRHLVYLAEACLLVRWTRQDGVTHIHAHFGTNSTTVPLLARALGGPSYSFTVHGPEEFDRPEALKLAEKIDGARFVVAISDYGRSQLLRWCDPSHWDRIHVIRCGVDDEFLGRPATPVSAGDRAFVCVGRLCEQKGQLVLVEAAARLRAECLPLKVVLVGDGPMRPLIEKAIARHGLADCIEITGWQGGEEVRRRLIEARALVLPSFAEGLPVVIMEALALGRPVISTYVAGIPELVRPGVNGWLVSAGSVEALAEAIREALAASPERLAEMGRAGAAAVAERHSVVTEVGKLAELFARYAEPGKAVASEKALAALS